MKNCICSAAIILIFCFLTGGCDSDEFIEKDTGIENVTLIEKGTCKITVEGYINKSFSGQAVFEDVSTGMGYSLFFLRLQDIIERVVNYRYVEFQGQVPVFGIQSIANLENHNDSTLSGIPARYNDSEFDGTFQSTGGSLEISSTDNNTFIGKFNFPAYGYVNNNGVSTRVEITVTGEFYAEEGSVGIILN
jgi:hypothetical protein